MDHNIKLQVGVKVFLQNELGKYLMLRRAVDKYAEIGAKWDIAGGRINPGSSLLKNLQREVKEETGLEIVGEPKLMAAQDIIIENSTRHIVRLTYSGQTLGKKVVLDPAEHDNYQWLSREEIIKLDELDKYLKELLDNGYL